ncbi:hypothetical protein ACLK1T_08630 [Escherichia coli]
MAEAGIVAVRDVRAEMNVAPGKPLELLLRGCSADAERRVNENIALLQTLARLESSPVLPAMTKVRFPFRRLSTARAADADGWPHQQRR